MVALLKCLVGLSALIPLVSAFANPLPCSGICTDTSDPALIRRSSDGTYFRFATGGGIPIFSSPHLLGPWTQLGSVLPSSGAAISSPGSKDAWAPDVHEQPDGSYVMYYAVSQFGTQNSVIGVATSPNLEPGSWTDHGSTGVSSKAGDRYNAIDPNFIAVDGVNYFNFGSFWSDIFQTTVDSSELRWTGAALRNIELNTTSPQPSEGSYVFAWGGYYYLFFSSGSCCNYNVDRPAPGDEYKVMVCRSRDVTGGYVDRNGRSCLQSGGTLVLGSHGIVYGPGGQGVYNDPQMGPVLYYHYVDTRIGYADGQKLLGINQIDFSSGWPVV